MKRVLVVMVLAFLLLAGCGQQDKFQDVNYFEGGDGLVFSVLQNSPPETVYPEEVFPVSINLENLGAFSYGDDLYANASIIFDDFYFSETEDSLASLKPLRERLNVSGKSATWPAGEKRLVTLGLLQAKSLGPRTGAKTPVAVTLCYPYRTTLTTQVCVDADSYNQDARMQVCEAEDLSFSDQGAPVAITFVDFESVPAGTQEVTVTSNRPVTDPQGVFLGLEEVTTTELVTNVRPMFRLTLQEVGDGQLIRGRDFDTQKLCSRESEADYPAGSVVIRGRLGKRDLICTPAAPKFIDGEAKVSCTLPLEDTLAVNTNYFDILEVELSYVYQVKETVEVEIDDSAKAYEPPELLTASCSDFDNQYELCRNYAQLSTGMNQQLDCYYCEESRKCLQGAGACSSCDLNTPLSDEVTRRCVAPCPVLEKPALLAAQVNGVQSVTLGCRDPSGVLPVDHHRCGCDVFRYSWEYTIDDCEGNLGRELSAKWNPSRHLSTATLAIDETFQNFMTQPDPGPLYLCLQAVSMNGVVSDTKAVRMT